MIELDKAIAEFKKQYNNKFEESDSEYFFSRRASMDEFSDCGAETLPTLSVTNFQESNGVTVNNLKILNEGNNSEDIDYSCTTEDDLSMRTLSSFTKSFLGQQKQLSGYFLI